MSNIRHHIAMIEATMRLDLARPLFHGTTQWSWEEIQHEGKMTDSDTRPSGGVCFSMSLRVAEAFSRYAMERQDCDKGVVIPFDTAKLMRDFKLEYHHPKLSSRWKISNEEEVRVVGSDVPNVLQYVTHVTPVFRNSSDEPWMWGPSAAEWTDDT